jgi:Dirigent-like protein
MRRLAVLPPLVAALASLAPAAAAQQPAPPSGTLELVQRDRETRFHLVDASPRQGERGTPTPGDVAVLSGVLRNSAGRRVGRVQACFTTVSRGRRYSGEATGTFSLRGGDVMVQGRVGDSRVDRLAVVGGTGVYAGARGTMAARTSRDDTRFEFAFMP